MEREEPLRPDLSAGVATGTSVRVPIRDREPIGELDIRGVCWQEFALKRHLSLLIRI